MNGFLYSNKTLLGEINFSHLIEKGVKETGMGGICGDFTPNENYELVRKSVQEWNNFLYKKSDNSQEIDFSKWGSLNFNVQLENGYFVLPCGGYEICDFEDFQEEPLQVRTVGIHSHIFSDYFINKKSFLMAPWRKISIEEKLEFEEKYKSETSLVKKLSFFRDYKWEPFFSSLGFNEKTQEVLYTTSNTKIGCFAIADFVNKDEKNNPTFEFYKSFDEFIEIKMN